VPNAQVCVHLTVHITITNYISKTSLYTTFRMYLLGPWPLKILMFALLVTREKQHTVDHGNRPETANIPQRR
jgi:hypothetical protein